MGLDLKIAGKNLMFLKNCSNVELYGAVVKLCEIKVGFWFDVLQYTLMPFHMD